MPFTLTSITDGHVMTINETDYARQFGGPVVRGKRAGLYWRLPSGKPDRSLPSYCGAFHCGRCNRPTLVDSVEHGFYAVPAPTGYRCPVCARVGGPDDPAVIRRMDEIRAHWSLLKPGMDQPLPWPIGG